MRLPSYEAKSLSKASLSLIGPQTRSCNSISLAEPDAPSLALRRLRQETFFLHQAIDKNSCASSVAQVILSGQGKNFCTGIDLAMAAAALAGDGTPPCPDHQHLALIKILKMQVSSLLELCTVQQDDCCMCSSLVWGACMLNGRKTSASMLEQPGPQSQSVSITANPGISNVHVQGNVED